MKVIAFEISSARGSVAVTAGNDVLFEHDFANDRKHSGAFFAAVRDATKECGAPDLIIVGLGPGSYAGVRIAVATAAGLAAAYNCKLAGVSSLLAIDIDAMDYAVIGDARRGSFFIARVHRRSLIEGPLLLSEGELRKRIADAQAPVFRSELIDSFASVPLVFPSARRIAALAETNSIIDPPLEPIYLRDPHITVSKSRTVTLVPR